MDMWELHAVGSMQVMQSEDVEEEGGDASQLNTIDRPPQAPLPGGDAEGL